MPGFFITKENPRKSATKYLFSVGKYDKIYKV